MPLPLSQMATCSCPVTSLNDVVTRISPAPDGLPGVHQEIQEHLLHLVGVHIDQGQVGVQVRPDGNVLWLNWWASIFSASSMVRFREVNCFWASRSGRI